MHIEGLDDDEQAVVIVKDQLEVLAGMLNDFDASDFFINEPVKQLKCLKKAANFMMQTEEKQLRFMHNAKKLKQAYNLCTSNKKITQEERDYIYFYMAVRSVIYKFTKGDAPDATQMNARVRQLIEDALSSEGIEEVFKIKETNKLIDIFSESYIEKIKALPLENMKVKILERLIKQKIEEFKKVNKIKGVDFSKKIKAIIDKYNERSNTVKIEHPNNNSINNLIPLGEGSYALTYKYYDDFYNRDFVVKRAKKNLSEKELKRFKQEFEIMKSLNSPYIVDVYSYNDDNNSYIMEYMDFTLDKFIRLNNDKISSGVRKSIILQLLKACKYLHEKGYLHRDLSPSNVLIKTYDDVLVVKIADFGLAKNPTNELTTVNTEFKGYFNDPNLKLEGFNNYAMPHEIYALTMLIYFISTGKTNTSQIDNVKLKRFVQKGLGDKANRYKSVDELCEAFKNI